MGPTHCTLHSRALMGGLLASLTPAPSPHQDQAQGCREQWATLCSAGPGPLSGHSSPSPDARVQHHCPRGRSLTISGSPRDPVLSPGGPAPSLDTRSPPLMPGYSTTAHDSHPQLPEPPGHVTVVTGPLCLPLLHQDPEREVSYPRSLLRAPRNERRLRHF